jgi:Icc-related predicted phosphoesterase
MKILVIGDPHGALDKVRKIPTKGVDLILLTGDLGKADLARKRHFENVNRKKEGLPELEDDAKFIKQMHLEIHISTIDLLKYLSKVAPVYTLQGNVGIPTLSQVKEDEEKYGVKIPCTRKMVNSMINVSLVKNRLRLIDDLRIGFLEYFIDTSWVKEFKPSDYRDSMKKAKKETDKAHRVLTGFANLDILVCHQPPYGILDKVNFPSAPKHWQGKHAGSKAVLDYVNKYHPRYVFCGHIHEGEGMKKIGRTEVYNLGVAGHKIFDI